MKSTTAVLLVGVLVAGCPADKAKQKQKIDTEETLRAEELELRKAYAADAMVSRTRISATAEDVDLCKSVGENGSTGPTPPMSVDCNAAEDRQCSPVETPEHPWEYEASLWDADVWKAIGYYRDIPHRYHYALEWKTLESGECEHRARVFGDLDGDGIFSTYESVAKSPGPPEWKGETRNVVMPLE